MSKMEAIKEPVSARITCLASDLRAAVRLAALAIGRKNLTPILGHLHITPQAGKLVIEGTNLAAWLRVECPATCAAGPAFTVRSTLLVDVLRGADASDKVSIQADTEMLEIACGPVTIRVRHLIPASDFPTAKEAPGATSVAVAEAVLAKAINSVCFAISTEETRYYLNGIYLHEADGTLAACATDGHRLGLYKTDAEWPLPAGILPRPAVDMLRRLVADHGNKPITCAGSAADNLMTFSGNGWKLTAKMIDGTFPDYNRAIPKGKQIAGYACLSAAGMKRLPPIVGAAKLDLANKVMSIDDMGDPEIEMPIEASGDFTVIFNFRYIREMARAFGTIKIDVSGAMDAATVLTEDPNLTVVIMPMRVS